MIEFVDALFRYMIREIKGKVVRRIHDLLQNVEKLAFLLRGVGLKAYHGDRVHNRRGFFSFFIHKLSLYIPKMKHLSTIKRTQLSTN